MLRGWPDRLRALQQLAELRVIAPMVVPMKDRVMTDRRDAERLARSLRAADLTAVYVSDAGSDALRDLAGARDAAKKCQLLARHRLSKFLLRSGQRPAAGKDQRKIATAVGRELLGFIWAIGTRAEAAYKQKSAAREQ